MVLLAAEGLNKTFGDKTVLDSVDIEIRRGDHIALVGPNGTGKTTLLRILTGQQPSDGGRISLSGSPPLLAILSNIQLSPKAIRSGAWRPMRSAILSPGQGG